MPEMKWTPGPYHVQARINPAKWAVCTESGRTIAEFDRKGDADRAAAVDDLQNALEGMVSAFDKDPAEIHEYNALINARAALARARGASPDA